MRPLTNGLQRYRLWLSGTSNSAQASEQSRRSTRITAKRLRNEDNYLMQRIGYFSIRGYWLAPLAVFVIVVVGGAAVPGGGVADRYSNQELC
jgi:hypothetical protein